MYTRVHHVVNHVVSALLFCVHLNVKVLVCTMFLLDMYNHAVSSVVFQSTQCGNMVYTNT